MNRKDTDPLAALERWPFILLSLAMLLFALAAKADVL